MLWTNDLENLYLEIVGCSLVKGNFVSLLPWSSLNELSSQYSREIKNEKERREGKKILNEHLEKQIRHIGWIMFASALPAW